jgi:hypothetical protein
MAYIISKRTFSKCQTGLDRYTVLKAAHEQARLSNEDVEYEPNLRIEIETSTYGNTPIELTNHTNFNGCTFVVKNTTAEFPLFKLSKTAQSVQVSKAFIDDLSGATVPSELSSDYKMLIITDENTWTERIGYSAYIKRKDILILKNGKHLNKTIAPYSTNSSNPSCKYTAIDTSPKIFENLHFVRDGESTHRTYLLLVENQCYVDIRNITAITHFGAGVPEDGYEYDISGSSLTVGDQIFQITDSAFINFTDVIISGTYCSDYTYGYGIAMDNVYHSVFSRLYTKARWGIFGNNFINEAYLNDCDINRFDIHCYGANIYFHHCTFRNSVSDRNNYNQYSSIYGKIKYDDCSFLYFLPVLLEESYNAYTGFELIINNSILIIGNKRQIVYSYMLDNVINPRAELTQKCLPNITINKMTIVVPSNVSDFSLIGFSTSPTYSGLVGYLSKLIFKDVVIMKENPSSALLLRDANYGIYLQNVLVKDLPATMQDVNIHSA